MSEFYELAAPSKVTVGAIGEPGQRAFYLQARDRDAVITVKAEKQQVAALALHLGKLLEDLARPGELPAEESLELEEFTEELFRAGTIALAYDDGADRIVLVVEERVEEDEQGDEVRISMTREQAGALAIRGTRLVEAGRPPCPLCGYPLDPRGHECPRTNGYHAPLI
jgi:uncharacterized repeat protein (TIGR03847 family)